MNINKKIIAFTLVLLAGVSQSCEDYLQEELVSDVSAATYYSTPQGWEDGVRATYAAMKNFFGVEIGFTMTAFGTDVHTNGSDGGHKGFNFYDNQLAPDTRYAREAWQFFYRGINQANAMINRADDVELDQEVKDQRILEVRFLRGFYYFMLTRFYGNIHLSLEETEGVEITANKTPASEIYSQAIIPDLRAAVAGLPNEQTDLGRVTKPAAEYLLGLALLTRSYQPFAEGTDAAEAETLFSNVINNYGFTLAENYRALWGLDELSLPDNVGGAEDNSEIIFAVQNAKGQVDEGLDRDGHRGHLYFLMEYDKLPGMQRDIENGRPWKRFRPTPYHLSLWNRDMDRRYDETYKSVWYANNEATIPTDEAGNLLFELGDTAIYIPGPDMNAKWDEAAKKSTPYVVLTPDPAFDGDIWFYNEKLYPTLAKFLDNTRPNRQHTQGQRDFVLMRLGEAYLLRAEARLQQGNAGGAAEDINVIRTRAAWDGMEEAMQITADQATLDFLLEERAREMDGEGHRWFTLTRTGTLVERVRAHNPEASPNIQDYHVLRPIPQEQIDRTEGGYEQNPGYPVSGDS
ncbi:RagB/SusD family nutrient uptake outer membrane protein [Tunicatimonas pelagia]|uniref:RagB/SusD family nutrient uptake outer membrane protein n=1 Tax=Tunicatimonas pelagia TaxID=931531 RepID=UPI002666E462|nr:RagB/SusD family nutrient uptake outer membrane protein [Tunicatimonas pelagia]WKN42853.1 RagB/SusD family nutrient uptake outer membrane protein [Tunicatimonas pelagia]